MARVYVVGQRKGGAAKSTTAAELVLAAAALGLQVLAIDLDSARAFTVRLGYSLYEEHDRTAADFLAGVASLEECVMPSPAIEGVDVIQAGEELDDLSDRSVTRLRDTLGSVENYDVVVIDTPGTYGRVVRAALTAADVLVVPMPAEGEPLLLRAQMEGWIHKKVSPLRRGLPELEVWYVPVMITAHQRLDRQMLELLEQEYPGRVTSPVRKVGTVVTSSILSRLPVGLYVPNDPVAQDYRTAMAQLLAGI